MCVKCSQDNCNCTIPTNDNTSSKILYDGGNLSCGNDLPLKNNTSMSDAFKSIVSWVCKRLRIPTAGIVGGNTVYQANTYVGDAITNIIELLNTYFGSTGAGLVDITHSELVIKKNTNTLLKGVYYRIIDFKTEYEQPNFSSLKTELDPTLKAAEIVPLIVFALNSNTLATHAYQEAYPNDVLQYILEYNTPVLNSPTKGRIVYRKDDEGNETDYDHREVLFKVYKNSSNQLQFWYDMGYGYEEKYTFSLGPARNNSLLGYFNNISEHDYLMDLPNTVFLDECHNNTFSDNSCNNIFSGVAFNNVFLGSCMNNSIIAICNNNQFKSIKNNTLDVGSFSGNIVSNSFNGNMITLTSNLINNVVYNFNNNNIGARSVSNNIIQEFSNNEINCPDGSIIGNNIFRLSLNILNGLSSIEYNYINAEITNNTFDNCSLSKSKSLSRISDCFFGDGLATNFITLCDIQSDLISQDFSLATYIYNVNVSKTICASETGILFLKYHDDYGAEISLTDITT